MERISGRRLRALRRRQGFTQDQLARIAGVSEKTIKRLEGEKTPTPQVGTIRAIAGALGVEPPELFGEADEPGSATARGDAGVATATAVDGLSPARNRVPLGLVTGGDLPFSGRASPVARLLVLLETAAEGRGRVVTIMGEPGIGKSRLVSELADQAVSRGAEVWIGRARAGSGAPPFWPWVQILRDCIEELPKDELAAALGGGAELIATLVPEIGAPRRGGAPARRDAERFTLFDAIARFWARLATHHTQVIVIEDLHAADETTLHLFEFLAGELCDRRVLLVGTYRDTEVAADSPLESLAGALVRLPHSSRVALSYLDRDETASLVEAIEDLASSEELIDALHVKTCGHPFYLLQVLQDLRSRDDDGADPTEIVRCSLPEGLTAAIDQRVGALGAETARVLQVAAVIGLEFSPYALAHATGKPVEELASILAGVQRAGLVRIKVTEEQVQVYEFAHGLVPEALYQGLEPGLRMSFHARVASALESTRRADLEPHLDALADHYFRAAPIGHVEKALEFATQAARAARHAMAFERAALLFKRAVALAEASPDCEQAELCALVLELGEALNQAGQGVESIAQHRNAARIARALGSPGLLGKAALGLGLRFGQIFDVGLYDPDEVALLEEALRVVPGTSVALRADLKARAAMALSWVGEHERAADLCVEAMDEARRCDEPATRFAAVSASYLSRALPAAPHERQKLARELRDLAEESGRRDLAFNGQVINTADALYSAQDIETFDRELDHLERLAEVGREPWTRWWTLGFRATCALARGDLADGLTCSTRQYELGRRAGTGMVAATYATHRYALDSLAGRWSEIDRALPELIRAYPDNPGWRCVRIFVDQRMGREEHAREAFERCVDRELDAIARPLIWSVCVALLAEICFELRDAERALPLSGILAPYETQNVVVGVGGLLYGPTSHYLALLAATREDWERSAALFAAAHERAIALRAAPSALRIEIDQLDAQRRRTAKPIEAAVVGGLVQRADARGWHDLSVRAAALEE